MFTVQYFDEATFDDEIVFSGTLEECLAFVGTSEDEDFNDELFIVEPDGFTVYSG